MITEDMPTLRYPQDLLIVTLAMSILLFHLPRASGGWYWMVIGMLGGFGAWTLLEYLIHRVVLHHVPPFRQWHSEHHRDPAQEMRTPLSYALPLIGGLALAPPLLLHDHGAGFGIAIGLLAGFAIQSWVHHRVHQPQPPHGTWLRERCRLHVDRHHVNPRVSFGTISAFWDRLLGTH